MIDARLAYGLGFLVGGATATLGWTGVARHPARMLARHRRMVRAYSATHGPGPARRSDTPTLFGDPT